MSCQTQWPTIMQKTSTELGDLPACRVNDIALDVFFYYFFFILPERRAAAFLMLGTPADSWRERF